MKVEERGDGTALVTYECRAACGTTVEVSADLDGLNRWRRGMAIEQAMPDEEPEVRDSLTSGLCSDCRVEYRRRGL